MKLYSVALVGVSQAQSGIAQCSAGETVSICREPDNPYDALALRVDNGTGEAIGYIAKSNWLRDAIHEQGRGCAATIQSIDRNDAGILGVVLYVTLTDDDVPSREYRGPGLPVVASPPAAARKLPRAETMKLIKSLVQDNHISADCTCGERYDWPLAGLTTTTQMICPRCRAPDNLTHEQAEHVYRTFTQGINEGLLKQGLAEVHASDVTFTILTTSPRKKPADSRPSSKGLFGRLFGSV